MKPMNLSHSLKTAAALLLALTMVLCALPALAENDDADTRTVTAVGTASVTVTPDTATYSLGVTTQDTLVANAQKTNATVMQNILDALKALGVAETDLQTDNYSISPVYDYQSGKLSDQEILRGYSVSNSASVTVRDLAKLPQLIDAAVAAGANQTYGVGFSSSEDAAAYDQALAAATRDALRKASLMAGALGLTAGDVLSVEEANDVYVTYAGSKSAMYDSASATPIQSGMVTVTANVRVVMSLR